MTIIKIVVSALKKILRLTRPTGWEYHIGIERELEKKKNVDNQQTAI